MTHYRLAIFDFDGTLADSLPWFRTSFQETIARFDLAPVSPEELEAMRGLSAREIMARLKVSMWQLPAIVSDMRRRKLAAASETPLFAGIPAMLKNLQRLGIRTAIVSSDSEASVRLVLGPTANSITCFRLRRGRVRQALEVSPRRPKARIEAVGDNLHRRRTPRH
jgi:phosphoglycolate phosphatase